MNERPKQTRMSPGERKQQLLDKGYQMAKDDGLGAVNRVQLGRACGVTDGLVSRYFQNAAGMYRAILERALEDKHAEVLADALEMDMLTDADRKAMGRPLLGKIKTVVDQRVKVATEGAC